jgi:very-short-patch-repair endonuclease
MTEHFNKQDYLQRRRDLRNGASVPERILWSKLKGKQILGLKFRRQYGIGSFVVDFYCVEIRLVIELDGSSHASEAVWEYDQERQKYIESLGLRVIRLTNQELSASADQCVEKIAYVAQTMVAELRNSENDRANN